MKTFLKVILIIICCLVIIGVGIATLIVVSINNAKNADEYILGNDIIKSVKAVVAEREVTGVSSGTSNGVSKKSVSYKSDSVYDDLVAYAGYLRGDLGFKVTKDYDLSVSPSTIELAKESVDAGQILYVIINYDNLGYTVTINKGAGSLTAY